MSAIKKIKSPVDNPAKKRKSARVKEPEPEYAPLCYRCDHRANWHETKHGPRYECGVLNSAVCGCYMYRPVRPLGLVREPSETALHGRKRMIAGPWMLAARCRGVQIANQHLEATVVKGAILQTWVADENAAGQTPAANKETK